LIVLGIDPGTLHMGWGVVERRGTRLSHVAHGVISPPSRPLAERLVFIEAELARVVAAHAPEAAAVEALFFHKDAQAAAKLGHARGVALLVCARAGLGVHEYAPARVKRTVTGRGAAEKAQVVQMIRALLTLSALPAADAADALAVAVTHLQHPAALPSSTDPTTGPRAALLEAISMGKARSRALKRRSRVG
jgi:crossover junction endodeoxyribonuclease RuvC